MPTGTLPPKATPQAVQAIFATFQQHTPAPRTELHYTNGYQLLVAVVLSAQATDKGVNKATAPLFARVTTPAEMLQLGEEGLTTYIRSIGLFRTKAKNVIALSQRLIDHHGGEVPNTMEALVSLPGVGRKTANVVLSQLFGQPTVAVDTHVFRVARRLGFSRGTTPDAVEADLLRLIPPEYLFHAHHWLILHGRYTCLAQRPRCAQCPVAAWCHSPAKTLS